MQLVIHPDGTVRCLYGELVDLTRLGPVNVTRASHVEPTSDGRWMVDLSPVQGPLLGPFELRSRALEAETRWLANHWL